MNYDCIVQVQGGQKAAVFGGKAVGVSAVFLQEGLVPEPEVVGIIPTVELVPVQNGLELCFVFAYGYKYNTLIHTS